MKTRRIYAPFLAIAIASLVACQSTTSEPKPSGKAEQTASKAADPAAPSAATPAAAAPAAATPAAAAPSSDEVDGALHNLGMWSEMYVYCGWKAEPFTDLRARLAKAPKVVAAKADLAVHFDAGVTYGAKEAKKRADQKANGETPSAWACGADVEASVLKEIDQLLAAE
jgi:hypothetical protein